MDIVHDIAFSASTSGMSHIKVSPYPDIPDALAGKWSGREAEAGVEWHYKSMFLVKICVLNQHWALNSS